METISIWHYFALCIKATASAAGRIGWNMNAAILGVALIVAGMLVSWIRGKRESKKTVKDRLIDSIAPVVLVGIGFCVFHFYFYAPYSLYRQEERRVYAAQREFEDLQSSDQKCMTDNAQLKTLPIQSPRQQAKNRAIELADKIRKMWMEGHEEWMAAQSLADSRRATEETEAWNKYAQEYQVVYQKDAMLAHEELLKYLDVGARDKNVELLYKNPHGEYEKIADDLERLAEMVPSD